MPPSGSHGHEVQGRLRSPSQSQGWEGKRGVTHSNTHSRAARGSLRLPPPILNPAMCFIQLVLRGRGERKKKKNAPPFFSLGWQHPLLRAVNSGDFSAQLGVQKRTATGTRAYGGINPSPCLPATLLAYSQPICRCEDLILYNWDSKCI